MFIIYLFEAWHRVSKFCPFFEILICTYRESVTIFHSFQVINMIFFMCWLNLCDKEGIGDIFITMNDSSINFFTSKPIFQNSYLQFTTCVWAVWKWIMGLPKQLKWRSFRAPWATWTPASFLDFQVLATFTPVFKCVPFCSKFCLNINSV